MAARADRGLPLILPFEGVPEREDAKGDIGCIGSTPPCLLAARLGEQGLRAELQRVFLPTALDWEAGAMAETQRGFL